MLEELLPTEELEIGILDPTVTQHLIAQVVHVLEKRKACTQLRRQRRGAGAIRIDRSELRLQKPPIDRARKLHQRVRQINDPIQPGAEQILLPGLLSLPRPHRSPSLVISRAGITASDSKESQKQFARKPQRRRRMPAKTITWKGAITHFVQRLGNTSRATEEVLRRSTIASPSFRKFRVK